MATWKTKFIDFDLRVVATASLTLEDLGNGHASGALIQLTGPVPVKDLELSGVVRGNEYIVGGSVEALGINLFLTFSPHVFSFTGSARISVHQPPGGMTVFVFTSPSEGPPPWAGADKAGPRGVRRRRPSAASDETASAPRAASTAPRRNPGGTKARSTRATP